MPVSKAWMLLVGRELDWVVALTIVVLRRWKALRIALAICLPLLTLGVPADCSLDTADEVSVEMALRKSCRTCLPWPAFLIELGLILAERVRTSCSNGITAPQTDLT